MVACRPFIFIGIIKVLVAADVVFMTGQLRFCKRGFPDSAGNTRPPPSTPRLPLLRRESHNDRHSTAAGCWQHRNWPRKGCACATGCRQFVRFRDRNQRPMSLTQEPRSWKFLFQIQRRQKYAYAQPAAPRSASCCRQCRKHPAVTLNPTSTGAQTRIT